MWGVAIAGGDNGAPWRIKVVAPQVAAELRAARRECTDALAAFRSFHLGMATKYLRRTDKGTGASDFRSMLKEAVESTREGRVR